MKVYYNEFDPKAAAWLRELIKAKLIADGDVDERSITDVRANELTSYAQCHFFAGIGGWSLALRFAGWPDDRPVWTGSCPCQPFSGAGRQMGRKDPRHLWPAFRRLINRGRPPVVFGEQVASSAGRLWLAGVLSDLETMGYAGAAADLCAPSVGAPHIRQRINWVAYADGGRREAADLEPRNGEEAAGVGPSGPARGRGASSGMADSGHQQPGRSAASGEDEARRTSSFDAWGRYDLVPCADGKTRRIESGTFPLVNGLPGRMGLLRGYGNAIVPQEAAEFILSSEEARRLLTSKK